MSGRRFIEKICFFGLMFAALQNYGAVLSFEGEVEGANSSVTYNACRGQNCTRIYLQGQDRETVYAESDDRTLVEQNSNETDESSVFSSIPPPPPPPPPNPPSHDNDPNGQGFTGSVNGSGSKINFERCITNSEGVRNCTNFNLQGEDGLETRVSEAFADNSVVDLERNLTGLFDWVEPFLNVTTFNIVPIRNLTAVRSQNGRRRLAEGNNRSVSNVRISYRDCVDNGQNGEGCTGFDAIQQNGQLRLVNLPEVVDGSSLRRKRCLRTCTKYKMVGKLVFTPVLIVGRNN